MACVRKLLLFTWVLVGSGIASIISEKSTAQTGAPEEPTFSETVKFIQAKLTDKDGTSECDWVTRNEKGITSFSANEDGSVAIERDRNSTGVPDNWNENQIENTYFNIRDITAISAKNGYLIFECFDERKCVQHHHNQKYLGTWSPVSENIDSVQFCTDYADHVAKAFDHLQTLVGGTRQNPEPF
jgi:hypothetical protein